MDNRQLYSNELRSKYKPMTKDEEKALFKSYHAGNRRAYDRIFISTSHMVISTAKKYLGQGVDEQDLIQAGNMGVLEAIQRHEPEQKNKFISYAIWWIRNKMLEEIANQGRFLSTTSTEGTNKHRSYKATNRLYQKLGRKPTLKEISKESGLSLRALKQMEVLEPQTSLDTPIPDSRNTLADVIPDSKFMAPDDFALTNLENKLVKFIEKAKLDNTTKNGERVIKLYYGIENETPLTLDNIGEMMCKTRERIRQIKEQCVKRLKKFNEVERRNNRFHLEPSMLEV